MDSKNIVESGVKTVMGVKEKPDDSQKVIADLSNPQFDPKATTNYVLGTVVQMAALVGLLWAANALLPQLLNRDPASWVITSVACGFFAFLTLRSRLFSPLDNTRTGRRYDAVQRPGWAPPPLAFPIIWMSIAVLRVVASYKIWQACDQNFLALPLIVFVVHLALGDTWNTIFTVEGRLGAAVPVVIAGPWLSSIALAIAYGLTLPVAGWIIVPSCVWLTIASLLVIAIWQLNGKEPLYPLVAQTTQD